MGNNKRQSAFSSEVESAEKLLHKTQRYIEAVKLRLDAGDVPGAYNEAFNFAGSAEKLALQARLLPAYTGMPQAAKMIARNIACNVPVSVGFTPQGWFGIYIPALLPKKSSGSAGFIREALYIALSRFFRNKDPVRYPDCTLVVRHVYHRERPERGFRDHDNIEINSVVDAIALYVLFDDAPLRCSHYYCSAPGDSDRTEVFVVPRPDFPAWAGDAKSYDGTAAALLEKCP